LLKKYEAKANGLKNMMGATLSGLEKS